jgi:DNA-binding transcriptional LysR family regulator
METMPPVELRYLRYFMAVAEELNYRRAAKRLHVSAPALSVQIKHLEELLGTRLFERDTTKVRLTVPGEVLLRESRELFAQVRRVLLATKDAAQGSRGRLRIAIHGVFGENLVPELVRTYHKASPGVDVTLLDFTGNEAQLKALEEGQVHVAFVVAFQPPVIEGLEHLLAIDAPLRAVMSVKHPLAAAKQVTLEELAGAAFLGIQAYETQTQSLIAVFGRAKLQPKIIAKANTINSCIAMLASGKGVALLPELRMLTQDARLALRPIKDAPPGLRLHAYAVWKREGATPQVLNFVELLRQAGVRRD